MLFAIAIWYRGYSLLVCEHRFCTSSLLFKFFCGWVRLKISSRIRQTMKYWFIIQDKWAFLHYMSERIRRLVLVFTYITLESYCKTVKYWLNSIMLNYTTLYLGSLARGTVYGCMVCVSLVWLNSCVGRLNSIIPNMSGFA